MVCSSMPNTSDVAVHMSEVIQLVEGAKILAGGWVGGDSWFGSVVTAVEVMKRFTVYSTWIIKQNQHFPPMKPLYAVLKLRFKDRPTGHWVVFQSEIAGVPCNGICMEP